MTAFLAGETSVVEQDDRYMHICTCIFCFPRGKKTKTATSQSAFLRLRCLVENDASE